MGYLSAYDAMNFMSLRMGIEHHLQYNCWPSMPLKYVDACIKAVELCVRGYFEDEKIAEKKIRMPDWKGRRIYNTPNEIVEKFRLDAFVDYEIERIEYENIPKKKKGMKKQ